MFTGCGERALLSAWKIIKSLLIGMRSKNHRYHHYYTAPYTIRLHFAYHKKNNHVLRGAAFGFTISERDTIELVSFNSQSSYLTKFE